VDYAQAIARERRKGPGSNYRGDFPTAEGDLPKIRWYGKAARRCLRKVGKFGFATEAGAHRGRMKTEIRNVGKKMEIRVGSVTELWKMVFIILKYFACRTLLPTKKKMAGPARAVVALYVFHLIQRPYVCAQYAVV